MLPYQQFKPGKSLVFNKSRGGNSTPYSDNIFTLDTETSTYYKHPSGWGAFDYTQPPEYYKDVDKINVLYIWQMSVDGVAYYGRTLDELKDFLLTLRAAYCGRLIIYIHNFAYEFQYLRNIIEFTDVFARKPRKPIYARTADNIEFRCSYMLTGMSLESLPKNFRLSTKKLVGDLDYDLCRTPLTRLTPAEMGYAENDVLVLHELIEQFKGIYKHVANIPYTSTGRIRRNVKKIMYPERKTVAACTPTPGIFGMLQAAFAGGYTHANAAHFGTVVDDVHSFDFASSYPAQMLLRKYPSAPFSKDPVTDFTQLDGNNKAYLLTVIFYGIESNKSWDYISGHKCTRLINATNDNGRIAAADELELTCTEIDIEIIAANYNYQSYSIVDCYSAPKAYLPKPFTDYIIELYRDKTKLKDVAGMEQKYLESKRFVNGLYGMCVTNTIADTVVFSILSGWAVKPLTFEGINSGLQDMRKKGFLNYAWGVWVTAYARRALWVAISAIDYNAVYCDTDSIKYYGDYDKFFADYNDNILSQFKRVCADRGYTMQDFAPFDPKGKSHPLGVFEPDAHYDKFLTWGAKKYAYEIDGVCHLTVAGLSKKAPLKSLADFTPGKTWGYTDSGRMTAYYNDSQQPTDVTDYQGNTYTINQPYAICLQPTTYTLGITPTFSDYCEAIQNLEHTNNHIII
jgi:hypothetical protein